MERLYYTAPTEEIFQEVKKEAIRIWETYDDTYGYSTEKTNQIKDMGNIKDNVMYIFAMFDIHNQMTLMRNISEEARNAVGVRYTDGMTEVINTDEGETDENN